MSSERLFSSVNLVCWIYFTPECPCAHLTSSLWWLDRMSVASIDFNHKQDPPASQPQVAPGGTQLARVVRVLGHISPKSSQTIWGKVNWDQPVKFLLNIVLGVFGDLVTFALVLGVKNHPATHQSRLGLHSWNEPPSPQSWLGATCKGRVHWDDLVKVASIQNSSRQRRGASLDSSVDVEGIFCWNWLVPISRSLSTVNSLMSWHWCWWSFLKNKTRPDWRWPRPRRGRPVCL